MNWLAAISDDLLGFLALQTLYSFILAAIVLIALRVLRVKSPIIAQYAWGLVMLRLLAPVDWSSPFSLRTLLDATLRITTGAPSAIPGIQPTSAGQIATLAENNVSTPLLPTIVIALWTMVAVSLCVVVFLRIRHFRRIASHGEPITNGDLLEVAERWRQRLGVRRAIRVVHSEDCLSPFTTGLRRPVIFLPTAMLTWSPAAQESIVAHEMAHIVRWDELWIIVGNLIRCVYFFNPVASLALFEMNNAREQLCDETVMNEGSIPPRQYSRALLNTVKLNRIGPVALDAVVGLVDRKEGIKMRVLTIQTEQSLRKLRTAFVVPIFLLLSAVLLPMAEHQSGAVDQTGTEVTVGVSGNTSEPSGDFTMPVRLTGTRPGRTEIARENGTTGVVVLKVTVASDGTVKDVTALRSLPDGLTEAAIAAVREWTYQPAEKNGEKIEFTISEVINYRGEDPREPPAVTELRNRIPRGISIKELTYDSETVHIKAFTEDQNMAANMISNLESWHGSRSVDLQNMVRTDDGFLFEAMVTLEGESQ